jgi:arylsulfatase A-like enzyme
MTKLTRRAAAGALAGFPAILKSQARRPNFLLIVTDDQRHDAMSCAGNRILQTPQLDRLAAGGVRFTEAFVTNPLCSPSRANMVTGLYSFANGVTTNGDGRSAETGGSHLFRPGTLTYPALQRRAGYFTAQVGKWHIATPPTDFEQHCMLPGQGVYHDPQMIANGARVKFRGYVDDVIADQTIEMLKTRPKDRPFSLWCGFKAPHRAWFPAERFAKKFEDIEIPEPPTFRTSLDSRPRAVRDTDMQIADMPDFFDRGVPKDLPREERRKRNFQMYVKNYYRTLLGVDENVGRILDYLDQEKLAENTILVFTGDNGFFQGEYGMFDKRLMYEPSIRVPMLVRYPAAVRAGQVDREHMVLNNDIAHTFLDYAGIERPAALQGHGLSWRPVLENRAVPWRQSWLYNYFEYPAVHCAGLARGVRTRRYKLIHYIQDPVGWEFFDLDRDPEERTNLYQAPEYQKQVADLQRELERLRHEVRDDRSQDGKPMLPCTNRMSG